MERYSAWNEFCCWKNPCRFAAGCPEYHFILNEGKLYRLKANETRAVLVKDLPIKPKEIRWGGESLWLFSDSGKSSCFLDPVSLECKTELVLLKFFFLYPETRILSITADALFLKSHSDEGDQEILFCLDRKTRRITQVYAPQSGIKILSFGPDFVWLYEVSADGEDLDLIVDGKGHVTPLLEHPDVGPLMPLVKEALEHVFTFSTEQVSDVCSRICFIDFFARQLYFSHAGFAEYSVEQEGCIYAFSFGDTDCHSARTVWPIPDDFGKADRQPNPDAKPWHTVNDIWERVLLFDGVHAVGLDRSGVNWIFQTPEGDVFDLGKMDCVEDHYTLLGDELYVRTKHDGWCKFHLARDVPKARKIEWIEEE